ncbi:hypothetical protein [Balneola vulgaris]|jgi:hypothetical protein|uniref:hypothetical protein n=1 Tax=Balneola vulgaris TaxID=287535 RepID=UPI000380C02E|nr:hypothetical protein [Balneola vulgaris]
MNLKERTRKELEEKIENLENIIAKRGLGSDYLAKAEKIQRDANLAIILGSVTAVLGIAAWSVFRSND